MNNPQNNNPDTQEVWVTGIGIVSSLTEGPDAHWQVLNNNPKPVLNSKSFAPYSVHPLIEPDWSTQIGRRDMRQMERWQQIGVYASGLALADAGLKDDLDACNNMDMIVAAGGGERDFEADTSILEDTAVASDDTREALLNERLSNDLRPTLFLAQLSNLLAGNISIVHKVTGSSRTFMGEEGAGISAVQTAVSRIRSGQSSKVLVGAASSAEREDMLLAYELGQHLSTKPHQPIGERSGENGNMFTGSCGIFLVLESRQSAELRGKTAYARLDQIFATQSRRNEDAGGRALEDLIALSGAPREPGLAVLSGASGTCGPTADELSTLSRCLPDAPMRAYSSLFGHTIEAQFPLGVALASLALSNGGFYPPFENTEAISDGPVSSVLVSTLGILRAEGAGIVRRIED